MGKNKKKCQKRVGSLVLPRRVDDKWTDMAERHAITKSELCFIATAELLAFDWSKPEDERELRARPHKKNRRALLDYPRVAGYSEELVEQLALMRGEWNQQNPEAQTMEGFFASMVRRAADGLPDSEFQVPAEGRYDFAADLVSPMPTVPRGDDYEKLHDLMKAEARTRSIRRADLYEQALIRWLLLNYSEDSDNEEAEGDNEVEEVESSIALERHPSKTIAAYARYELDIGEHLILDVARIRQAFAAMRPAGTLFDLGPFILLRCVPIADAPETAESPAGDEPAITAQENAASE